MSGGSRPNSGRKSKAEELKLAETIDSALGETWVDDLLRKIYTQAKNGSFQHAQLLLAYYYGKPQDHIDLTTKGSPIERKEIIFKHFDKP